MRQVLSVTLLLVAMHPQTFAQNGHDWSNVQKLKHGTKLMVVLWTDNPFEGRFESASVSSLRIAVGDSRTAVSREFQRESIRSVTRLRGPRLRQPDPWMRNGALIGAAGGFGIGIARDVKGGPGAGLNWLLDGVAGAGLGFFAGCVAAAGKGVVVLFHNDKLIYRDDRPVSSFPELQHRRWRRSR